MSESKVSVSGGGENPDVEAMRQTLKEVDTLLRALEGTLATRVSIQSGSLHLEVERHLTASVEPMAVVHSPAPNAVPVSGQISHETGVVNILAPLVGVFYHGPAPGAPPFIKVGDKVERGQVVGIVEAMKVMNDVVTEYRGVVTEILVADGTTVAYEQALLCIDTATSHT